MRTARSASEHPATESDPPMVRDSTARALFRIFRLEYIFAALPGLTITFFVCARSPGEFLHRAPVEGNAIIALMILSCLGINTIVDRDIDGQYLTGKNLIARAVVTVGLRRTWAIIALMNVITLALAIDLCIQFQSWIPMALVLTEAVFAYGYSVPPLQFKLRGVLPHAISLALATCGIPFVLSVYTFLGTLPAVLILFIVGFGAVQYGFEFANQALDYLEDKAAGLRTPAVRLGIERSMLASLVVPLTGMAILFAALLMMYFERSSEINPLRPTWEVLFAWGISVLILIVGYSLPVTRTWQMLRLCRRQPPAECVRAFPALCHYARWQASSVTGVAVATATFFVVTNCVWR